MITRTIDDLLEACPDVSMKTRLLEAFQSWKTAAGTTSELFLSVRKIIASSSASRWQKAWFEFEDAVRRHSTVLTPYELSRTLGAEDQFETSIYRIRASMTDRLRLDCDFPEEENRAAEEATRLAGMTPEQRQQHEQQQHLEHQRRQQIMQQMMQGQDSWLAAERARFRAGRPRKMLDQESLEHLNEVVRSRGINLNSREALTIEANDVEEAIQFARLASHEQGCDLFRGQPVDWNPAPNILRLPIPEQDSTRWRRFKDWALNQQPLAEIAQNQKKLGAIAQHYGLPTYLLDFTKNPRVAAFFATHTKIRPKAGKGCIYCLTSGSLDAAYHYASASMRYYEVLPETERVEVDGLFRMQAQEGSFVYTNQTQWTSKFQPLKILFPRTGPIPSPLPQDIYPSTKSAIEVLVEDYFINEPDSLKQNSSRRRLIFPKSVAFGWLSSKK